MNLRFNPGTMVKKLLAAGADANAALHSGETPLMLPVREGQVATVHALLEGGANPSAKEKNGLQTALMWAISGGHSAVTKELVQYKVDVNAVSKSGSTALMFADVAAARKQLDGLVAELVALSQRAADQSATRDRLQAEFDAYRGRPWWRRLAG